MRVALAQINSVMGDFSGNGKKIIEIIKSAQDRFCDLVVFPELALFGYSPNDLLERRHLVDAQLRELPFVQKQIPKGMAVILGAATHSKADTSSMTLRPFCNSAVWLEREKKIKIFSKEYLPNYDVYDENRHFASGSLKDNIVKFKGHRIQIAVCEDLWSTSKVFDDLGYKSSVFSRRSRFKTDLIVSINGSPFALGKAQQRVRVAHQVCRSMKAPLVYVNMVGGQDELIFDGGSFVIGESGKILSQSLFFEEDLNVFDLDKLEGGFRRPITAKSKTKSSAASAMGTSDMASAEELRQALVLGIRDFVRKQGFSRVHLGLSGGIDSAVVACLAVDALGPSQVTCVALPGPFSAPESLLLARELATKLGCPFKHFAIDSTYENIRSVLDPQLGVTEFQTMHENIQARLRGIYLMAFSNLSGSMLLTTGNKSEYATGYATLYGDMCGGLAPVGDLLKRQVYALAAHYNHQSEIIPQRIIDRPPTAELRANQKDQDTLPPYDELDDMVEYLMVARKAPRTEKEKWFVQAMAKSEFKRWQAPPILRVSPHAFGRGRRMPIVNVARS